MLYLRYLLITFVAMLFLAGVGQFVLNALDKVSPFLNF